MERYLTNAKPSSKVVPPAATEAVLPQPSVGEALTPLYVKTARDDDLASVGPSADGTVPACGRTRRAVIEGRSPGGHEAVNPVGVIAEEDQPQPSVPKPAGGDCQVESAWRLRSACQGGLTGAAGEEPVTGRGGLHAGGGACTTTLQGDHRRGARLHRGITLRMTAPSAVFGVAVDWPTGPRGHLVSDFPAARRVRRSPRFTSTTHAPLGAIAAGAFDAERFNPPVGLGPRDQRLVAARVATTLDRVDGSPARSPPRRGHAYAYQPDSPSALRARGHALGHGWPPRDAAAGGPGGRQDFGPWLAGPYWVTAHPVSWLPDGAGGRRPTDQ